MGDRVQVHVFGDPGTEMMPDCSGCMCLNHCKYCVCLMISLFTLFQLIGVPGVVLGVILVTFGDPGEHFGGLGGGQARILMDSGTLHRASQDSRRLPR